MITRRKILIGIGASALASPLSSLAQQQQKVHRIGILFSDSSESAKQRVETFIQALGELGYVEGRNILIQRRFAEGIPDRLRMLAADLVQQKVDVIFVNNTPAAHAAKQATSSIPVVFASAAASLETGLVASLARPGGNLTGVANVTRELVGKRVQLLKEAFPRISRIAVVVNPIDTGATEQFAEAQRAAKLLGMQALSVEVRGNDDIEPALSLLRKWRADSLCAVDTASNFNNRRLLAELAVRSRLPAIFGTSAYAEAGGLVTYGADVTANYARAAVFVDKILKGMKPGDLPVELPTKFELVINSRTAKALGITIPQSILVRADRVIE